MIQPYLNPLELGDTSDDNMNKDITKHHYKQQ